MLYVMSPERSYTLTVRYQKGICSVYGSSDIGKTADKLKPYLSPGAEIIGARLFSSNVTEEESREKEGAVKK